MKTNEVEKQFGISRQTLFFYEREGLLHPERTEGDWREYGSKDIRTLKLILFLRDIQLPLKDIKALFREECSFQSCLKEQGEKIHREMMTLADAERKIRWLSSHDLPLLDYADLLDSWQKTRDSGRPAVLGLRKNPLKIRRRIILLIICVSIYLLICLSLPVSAYSRTSSLLMAAAILTAGIRGLSALPSWISFEENGIHFFQTPVSIREQLQCIQDIMAGRELHSIRFFSYQEISSLRIITKKRVVRCGVQILPEIHYAVTYRFVMNDGTVISLEDPAAYDNDRQITAIILLNRISSIHDPDHMLTFFAEGKNISEAMK